MASLPPYARNVSMLAALSVLQRGIGVMTSVVLARGLGAVGLGTFNVVSTTWNSAFGMLKLGVDTAMHVQVAERDRSPADRGEVLGTSLVLLGATCALGVAVCVGLARPIAEGVFGEPDLAPWVRVAGVFLVAQFVTQYAYSALAGLHAFGRYARVTAATAAASLVLVAAGTVTAGLTGAVAGAAVATALGAIGLAVVLRQALRAEGLTVRFTGLRTHAAHLLALGLPFYGAGLLAVPIAFALQGLVSREAGVADLGVLRVVTTLTALISFLPASIGPATVSSLVAVRTGDASESFDRHAALNLKVVWLGCLATAIAVCGVLPWLVPAVFGAAYVEAVPAARVGLLGATLLAVEGVVGQVLFSGQRVRALSVLLSLRSALFLGLGWLWISGAGVMGYLAAELVSLGGGVALFVAASWLRSSSSAPVGPLLVLLGVQAACAAALLSAPAAQPAIGGLVSLGCMAALLWVAPRYVLAADETAALTSVLRAAGRRLRPGR